MGNGFAIVVDIGKTLAKVSLWSREGELIKRETRRNKPVTLDGIKRLDVGGIEAWLVSALQSFAGHPVEYIIPVAHGAGVIAIGEKGSVMAPFDYEQELPAEVVAQYRGLRAPFAETGSPALPSGLNFGAQLYWLEQRHPGIIARSTLIPWAQYWAWFLSGVATSEVTSLGCHSDLWAPQKSTFSSLAHDQGWAARFAPMKRAGDTIGSLKAEISEKTGIPKSAKVLAGLHDSNAALMAARGFPEIAQNEATVLSTGTWFIAMRLPQEPVDLSTLPEARDCLVNIDAFGNPVPSARFMGGREIETLIEIDTRQVDIKPDQPHLLAAVSEVISSQAMVLPTLAPDNGPFPDQRGGWVNRPDDWYARRAGACLYAALVADTSLDLIGARSRLLIEGRFGEAEVFVRALASLRPDTEVYVANAHNDVSFGALRLIDASLKPKGSLRRIEPLDVDLTRYREAWLARQKVPA